MLLAKNKGPFGGKYVWPFNGKGIPFWDRALRFENQSIARGEREGVGTGYGGEETSVWGRVTLYLLVGKIPLRKEGNGHKSLPWRGTGDGGSKH